MELRRRLLMQQTGGTPPTPVLTDYLRNEKGKSYIDLNYNMSSNTGLYVDFVVFDKANSVHAEIIGTSGGNANFLIRYDSRWTAGDAGGYSSTGTIWKCNGIQGGYNYGFDMNTRYSAGINIEGSNKVVANGTEYSTYPYTYSRSDKCYLFATSGNGSNYAPYGIGEIGIFNAKIFESGVLVMDLYPYTQNGVNGMYDIINNNFYGNAGTGGFTIEQWVGGCKLLIINKLRGFSAERRAA